jgi:hypothetical protein
LVTPNFTLKLSMSNPKGRASLNLPSVYGCLEVL